MIRLALFQPDIPQNAGTMLRTAACLNVGVDIIGPCGFVFSDRHLRRSAMDYIDRVALRHHDSWEAFVKSLDAGSARLILLTTQASIPYVDFPFLPDDVLLVGRESAGVPQAVHDAADARLAVPIAPGARSLNVAAAAAFVLGEALRQTGSFP